MMNKDELYHYGVPGMKWGVRRSEAKLSRVSNRSKKRGWSDDATEVAKIRTKKVSQMSNAELNKVNNRKNLERSYSQLNPNAIKKGLAIAGATVAAMGTISALYKNSKKIVDTGKSLAQKGLKKYSNVKANKVSNTFWKEMRKVPKSNMDFSDLLK